MAKQKHKVTPLQEIYYNSVSESTLINYDNVFKC